MDTRIFLFLFLPFFSFLLSILIGWHLLKQSSTQQFSKLAGWLTLKPLIATPLFIGLSLLLGENLFGLFTPYQNIWGLVISGPGLTLLMVYHFRGVIFQKTAYPAWILIIFDTIRWGSVWGRIRGWDDAWSMACVEHPGSILFGQGGSRCAELPFWIEIIVFYYPLLMPALFALVALALVRSKKTDEPQAN